MDDDVGIEATQQEVARALFGGRFAFRRVFWYRGI